MITPTMPASQRQQRPTTFLWLEITGKCPLHCFHCYADSGPEGLHGTMTTADWISVLDDAAAYGVRMVQFIGGEPTTRRDLEELIRAALARGLNVEVFSNLAHIRGDLWEVFSLPGVSLATSWYSDDQAEHERITGRDTHANTAANISRAAELGIPCEWAWWTSLTASAWLGPYVRWKRSGWSRAGWGRTGSGSSAEGASRRSPSCAVSAGTGLPRSVRMGRCGCASWPGGSSPVTFVRHR